MVAEWCKAGAEAGSEVLLQPSVSERHTTAIAAIARKSSAEGVGVLTSLLQVLEVQSNDGGGEVVDE